MNFVADLPAQVNALHHAAAQAAVNLKPQALIQGAGLHDNVAGLLA